MRLRTVAIVTTFAFIVAEIPGCPDFLRNFSRGPKADGSR
jgi:hypothetical protein